MPNLETVTTPNHHGDREGEAGEQRNPTKCENVHRESIKRKFFAFYHTVNIGWLAQRDVW